MVTVCGDAADDCHAGSRRSVMKSQIESIGIVLSVLFVTGCSSLPSGSPPSLSKKFAGVHHVVRPGENLYRIAKAYDVPVSSLARANGIKDPAQIRVGQRIFVPGARQRLPVEIITPADTPAPQQNPAAAPKLPADGFLWPVSGMINSRFGARGASFHDGIDIAAPEGTPILAIESGIVAYSDQLRGYGNIVIIRHAEALMSVYAHNQINLVREGEQVERGAVIAKVGRTGRVTGPHLHFEIRQNNTAQDPLRFLPQLCCAPASDTLAPSG